MMSLMQYVRNDVALQRNCMPNISEMAGYSTETETRLHGAARFYLCSNPHVSFSSSHSNPQEAKLSAPLETTLHSTGRLFKCLCIGLLIRSGLSSVKVEATR
jgi:hypothetical protein